MPVRNVIYRQRQAGHPLTDLSDYRRAGGYAGLRTSLERMDRDEVLYAFRRSGLRGRGGAGFPMGTKAGFIPKESVLPAYVVCNADESEPGTFKDREIIEANPFQLIEGVAIAGYAIGAGAATSTSAASTSTRPACSTRPWPRPGRPACWACSVMDNDFDFDITLYRGAGAYICGEETALIESLEGKRGQPRLKPPFPAVEGPLASRLVNNVETLGGAPRTSSRAAPDWFASMGTAEEHRHQAVLRSPDTSSGRGTEIVIHWAHAPRARLRHGGRLPPRARLQGRVGGRLSMNVLWAPRRSTPRSTTSARRSRLPRPGVGRLHRDGRLRQHHPLHCCAWRPSIAHESCGKCTPCREGTLWLERILQRIVDGEGRMEDLELIESLSDRIGGRVLCALADTGILPVRSAIRRFRDDFVRAIEEGGDPRPGPDDGGRRRWLTTPRLTCSPPTRWRSS